jgi:bla regulator protein blaR1
MIALTLAAVSFSAWSAIGAPLANHLWQSTVFAGLAGVLTLALRKNRAHTRYRIWLAASLKFLIPFSLLIAAGSYLDRSKAPAVAQQGLSIVVQQIGQPFAAVRPAAAATLQAVPTPLAAATHFLPWILLSIWFCGFAAVIFTWCLRWRRVTAAVHGAMTRESGRELDALRRVVRNDGTTRAIAVVVSPSMVEPGIVGIFRPLMLLPDGISERLTDAQLDAILAHELCHARRRDNLAAAIHMLVEAIFWFHPLVWWIGSRLIEERERACDEEVLRSGSEAQAYAEAILKVCEFYLQSPVDCVAGISGASLKKRMEEIMQHRIPRKLTFARKLMLSAAGVAAVILPFAIGFANPLPGRAQTQSGVAASTSVTSDGITIKPHASGDTMFRIGSIPGGWQMTGASAKQLIGIAYDLQDFQISGGPAWLDSQRYDLTLKMNNTGAVVPQPLDRPFPPEVASKLQSLLNDQFDLVFHRETRQLPVYAMVVEENGPKMTEIFLKPPAATGNNTLKMQAQSVGGPQTTPSTLPAPGTVLPGSLWVRINQKNGEGQGQISANGVDMEAFAHLLSTTIRSEVLDRTGLTGTYQFTLDWTSDSASVAAQKPGQPAALSPAFTASLLAAVSTQLGLDLKQQTGPVEIFVVDKAEELASNSPPAAAGVN